MTTIAMAKGANHRHLVSQFAEHGKVTAESDTGDGRFHLTEHRSVLRGSRHFRVEGLHVRGTTLEVQHNDAFVAQEIINFVLPSTSLQGQEVSKAKTTQPKRSHSQELPARTAFAVGNGLAGTNR